MLTLKNCRLIPELTEGFEGAAADIVLDKGLIEGIYPVGMAPAGEGCETLDMKGHDRPARLLRPARASAGHEPGLE